MAGKPARKVAKKVTPKATKESNLKSEPEIPAGHVVISLADLQSLQKKAAESGKSELESDIIEESVKLAKNEVSSAYQLVQYAKELIAVRRSQH